MLELSLQLAEEIRQQAAAAYPYEGCGLLLGTSNRTDAEISNVAQTLFPVENEWQVEEEKRERFLITPRAMMQAEMAALRQELDVIGIYHSHPDHEPVASPRDLTWATWPGYSYLITEVRQGRPGESRSWQLRDDRAGFVEEAVAIAQETVKK